MGKNSNFARRERDAYFTPYDAVIPLLSHLKPFTKFIEPCAGDGRLIKHLESDGHKCVWAGDIEPQAPGIEKSDCLMMGNKLPPCDLIITNPPWSRDSLHQMIELFRNHAHTWLLFDAGWMFTGQARPFLPYCHSIVTIGRVCWIDGTKIKGTEDCCWYGFGPNKTKTTFFGKDA